MVVMLKGINQYWKKHVGAELPNWSPAIVLSNSFNKNTSFASRFLCVGYRIKPGQDNLTFMVCVKFLWPIFSNFSFYTNYPHNMVTLGGTLKRLLIWYIFIKLIFCTLINLHL